jgi:hypothetical protein
MFVYEGWFRYFAANGEEPRPAPSAATVRLSGAERAVVSRSIQQFQLGEWARGRGFRRRAQACRVLAADPWFLPALDLFIAEEQTHSGMLGQLLDLEGIPRLACNWTDSLFRRLRKLAGLETCVAVLVTAEILAVPFYSALRAATASPLLRAICTRILRDESAHLRYQALTLRILRRRTGWLHTGLFYVTAMVVWRQHRPVFNAAGWNWSRYWKCARSLWRAFPRLPACAPAPMPEKLRDSPARRASTAPSPPFALSSPAPCGLAPR